MSFEIVDGMTGTKHISSDDLAVFNSATVGSWNCVLAYGDRFALTMTDSNHATLGSGAGLAAGRRFWNNAATSLTIQSGTQGQNRNDIVVAQYKATSAGIESVEPVVVKGTPTTGTAADPNVPTNCVQLWRVPLRGITVSTPQRLFAPVTPLLYSTNYVDPVDRRLSTDLTLEGVARGNSVTLHILTQQLVTTKTGTTIGYVKAGYFPKIPARAVFGAQNNAFGMLFVGTEGEIRVLHRSGGDNITWGLIDISLTYTA